jgi:hypothetical protein
VISNQMLVVILGVSGLGLLFAPEAWKSVLSLFKKKQQISSASEIDTVQVLSDLIKLRRHLADDPKAIEAIDTLITPSVIRKEGAKKHES